MIYDRFSNKKFSIFVSSLTFVVVFLSTMLFTVASVLALSRNIELAIGLSPILAKLLVLGVATICLGLIIHPEKLVYFSYAITVLVLTLSNP